MYAQQQSSSMRKEDGLNLLFESSSAFLHDLTARAAARTKGGWFLIKSTARWALEGDQNTQSESCWFRK